MDQESTISNQPAESSSLPNSNSDNPLQTATPPSGQTSSTTPAMSNQPKSQSSKAMLATTIICAVLAVAGIAFGIYFVIDSNDKSAQVSDLQSKLDLIKAETGTELIETEEDDTTITVVEKDSSLDFDKKVRDLIFQLQDATSSLGNVIVPTYDYGHILVKNTSARTLLPLQNSYGLYGATQGTDFTISDEFVNLINNKLTELGFVNNDDIDGPFYLTGGTNLINHDAQIACNISGGNPFAANCGHLSWLTEEAIFLANQLAEAYYEEEGDFPFSIDSNHYNLKDSQITPYQTLTVPVGNAMGLFYRISPESSWQFFKVTQSAIPCQAYNTLDLKNAFAGNVCYDETTATNSTVQP